MEEMRRERRSEADDEVSLVDLTFMFLKHRRTFYLVFFSALVLGVIYAFFVPHKYEYVTLVGLAEKEPGTFIVVVKCFRPPSFEFSSRPSLPHSAAIHRCVCAVSVRCNIRSYSP